MPLVVDDLGLPKEKLSGARVLRPFSFITDGAYAAGGYAVSAASLGMATIENVMLGNSGGFVPEWDAANSKLKITYGNYTAANGPLAEVPNNHPAINAVEFRGHVIGTV